MSVEPIRGALLERSAWQSEAQAELRRGDEVVRTTRVAQDGTFTMPLDSLERGEYKVVVVPRPSGKPAEARVAELEGLGGSVPTKEYEMASHAELVRLCGAEASLRKRVERERELERGGPTPEEIEAAARAIWSSGLPFDELDATNQTLLKNLARSALIAARNA